VIIIVFNVVCRLLSSGAHQLVIHIENVDVLGPLYFSMTLIAFIQFSVFVKNVFKIGLKCLAEALFETPASSSDCFYHKAD
jgi:hypothetical protein